MNIGYPKYKQSSKQGERGVSLVSQIVIEDFGWLFKRNHQEHDFGIDGQLEIITQEGVVTGQMIAVQIKCGKSFFKEQNKWGYIYRGETKHFNYLTNYPIPVLIIICDPELNKCYWIKFEAENTHITDKGWKLTIPFSNDLKQSKNNIESLLPPPKDYLSDLEEYWSINKLISDSAYIQLVIDKSEVEELDITRPRLFFDRLIRTKELAFECKGKVEISFHGYNSDNRELFEIKEVRKYISILEPILPELFFFVRTEKPTYTLRTFALCLTNVYWPNGRSTSHEIKEVQFDTDKVADFMSRHFPGLNAMTEWLSMSEEENKEISFNIMTCLGFPIPNGYKS